MAQPATTGQKPETSCTTLPAATSGHGEEKTSNSMAVEKSAIVPEAGGSNSAAPTVQSGGKPMQVAKDCPPIPKQNNFRFPHGDPGLGSPAAALDFSGRARAEKMFSFTCGI